MSDFLKGSLDEFLSVIESGSRPKGGVTLDGDIPSLGGENVTEDGQLIFYPTKKIGIDFYNRMSKGILKELDVLINKDGANTGKSAIYRKSPYRIATVNEHLFILRGKSEALDQIYLHYLLLFPHTRRELNQKITGSAQPGLNSTFVENFSVELPPIKEQQKIAEILSSVDEVIENKKSQIDKLEDLKKATMNELLTKGIGHTEFKETEIGRIPRDWSVQTIGELSVKVGSGVTPKGGSNVYQSTGIKFIRSQNIYPDEIRLDDVVYIPARIDEQMSATRVKSGDLLLNITGASIGRCAVFSENLGSANVNQHVCIIRLSTKICPRYLMHWINSNMGQRIISKLQAGGNREGLNFQQIRAMQLPIPHIEQQHKLVEVIDSVSDKIKQSRLKRDSLLFIKKSLMQDLLTGKVRVKVN